MPTPGTTLQTAGELPLTLRLQTVRDAISPTNLTDYYRFTLGNLSSFALLLTEVAADVNVALLNSAGSVVSIGGVEQRSTNPGLLPDSIHTLLEPGTYYIQVSAANPTESSRYQLNAQADVGISPFLNGLGVNPRALPNWLLRLESIVDLLWRNLIPLFRVGEPPPIDLAGNTLASSLNLGTLRGTANYRDALNRQDPNDYYRFTVTATSNFSLLLNGLTGNADVQLLSAEGNLLQASTNAGNAAESIDRVLNAGTYYLRVYTPAESTSSYQLTLGATDLPTAEIRGRTWNDSNRNGLQDAGELGLAGWTIFLDQNQNGLLDASEVSTLTDSSGGYSFTSLTAGTYRVTEVLQPGWQVTVPSSTSGAQPVNLVTLSSGQVATEINFGNRANLPTIALTPFSTGLTRPTDITGAGDGSNRLFVVEQTGRIRVLQNGNLLPDSLLDIRDRVRSGGEEGLLSVAFPTNYTTKRYFYVYYTNGNSDIVIARYRLAANSEVADPSSEEIILTIAHPTYTNHNGGQLAFGPDGYLYIGTGDGGGAGDPNRNAQNPDSLLGKILRIDVETPAATPYLIPASNPFRGPNDGYRDEIWALGLRNPWRFSFDRATGDLYMGDVGQGAYEEVNVQLATSRGGENYGWNILEGNERFNNSTGDTTGLVLPVAGYDRSQGASITGGFVYRGAAEQRLQGVYLYGDFVNGRLWGLRRDGTGWENQLLLDSPYGISTFGQDNQGNLYVADYFGAAIYRVTTV